MLFPLGRIALGRTHHDSTGIWSSQFIHHGFIEYAAFAVENYHLRLEAVGIDLGLKVGHDVIDHSPNTLWVLYQNGHLSATFCEIVTVLLTEGTCDLFVGFVDGS